MGLSDIAAGIEVTESQEQRGVVTIDETDTTLSERLDPFESELPCSPAAAATVLTRYSDGAAIDTAAHAAGLAPTTAAKTLHLLGESVFPLGPMGREIVQDWLDGRLTRSEALELARAGERTFALAVFVETHDPLEKACTAVEGLLAAKHTAGTESLVDPTSDCGDVH